MLQNCSIPYSNQPKRKGISRRDAGDGVGDQGPSESPDGALVLDRRIGDADAQLPRGERGRQRLRGVGRGRNVRDEYEGLDLDGELAKRTLHL